MNLRPFLSRYTSLFRTVDTNKPSLSSVYQHHTIVRTRPLYILKPQKILDRTGDFPENTVVSCRCGLFLSSVG